MATLFCMAAVFMAQVLTANGRDINYNAPMKQNLFFHSSTSNDHICQNVDNPRCGPKCTYAGGRSNGRREVCRIWYHGDNRHMGCGNNEPYASSIRCKQPASCNSNQYESNGQCRAVTQCTPSEYHDTATTETSNRVCARITVCNTNSQYTSKKATGTSDAVCAQLTPPCLVNGRGYEVKAPTKTSDRVCVPLTPCESDEFIAKKATAQTDRACKKLTICEQGKGLYIKAKGSQFSDRTCGKLTVCTAGQYEAKAPADQFTDRVCASATACAKGKEYQTQAATKTSDRQCAPLRTCSSTEWEVKAPTPEANRVCRECTTCQSWDGQTADKQCTATADAVCRDCTSCADNQFEVSSCRGHDADRVCQNCTACSAEQYMSRDCQPLADRRCEALTHCTPGAQYELRAATPSADRRCKTCSRECLTSSEFEELPCTVEHDRKCTRHSSCEDGMYIAAEGNATHDTVCSPVRDQCAEGKEFESARPTSRRNRECTPLRQCNASEYETGRPARRHDRECAPLTICTADEYEVAEEASADTDGGGGGGDDDDDDGGGDGANVGGGKRTSDRVCKPLSSLSDRTVIKATVPSAVSDEDVAASTKAAALGVLKKAGVKVGNPDDVVVAVTSDADGGGKGRVATVTVYYKGSPAVSVAQTLAVQARAEEQPMELLPGMSVLSVARNLGPGEACMDGEFRLQSGGVAGGVSCQRCSGCDGGTCAGPGVADCVSCGDGAARLLLPTSTGEELATAESETAEGVRGRCVDACPDGYLGNLTGQRCHLCQICNSVGNALQCTPTDCDSDLHSYLNSGGGAGSNSEDTGRTDGSDETDKKKGEKKAKKKGEKATTDPDAANASQAGSSGDGGDATTIVAVVIVLVMLAVGVVVGYVLYNRQRQDGQIRDVSFSNPLYAETPAPKAGAVQGLVTWEGSAEATSGYMDVAANSPNEASYSGYAAELPAAAATYGDPDMEHDASAPAPIAKVDGFASNGFDQEEDI